MTLKELLDSLSFDEIVPFLIRHYHTIMRQEIWLLKSQLAACGIHHFVATYPTIVKCSLVSSKFSKRSSP